MFWGLNLKPSRKYTQTVSKSFHISQAALDVSNSPNGSHQIFITCENQKFLICTLHKDKCEQVMLDLNFAQGDEICFQLVGTGNVSLSGYLVEDDAMDFMNGDDEEEDSDVEVDEDLRNTLNRKNKSKKVGKAQATQEGDEDDDDDEDDSDFNPEAALTAIEGDEEEDDDDDDDDDDGDEDDDDEEEGESAEDEEDSEDEEVKQPIAKQPKLEKTQQKKQQNGVDKSTADKKGKKDKKIKNESQQQQQKIGGERTLTGGVKVEDIRVGNGPEAKTGKRVQVYYEGRLKTNNKVFDSLKTGAGFKFGLGRGEVIKGWDVGVVGMKVGGKRRITCPPHMAYGARGSPPTIPPNSTLVFEVELKSVN